MSTTVTIWIIWNFINLLARLQDERQRHFNLIRWLDIENKANGRTSICFNLKFLFHQQTHTRASNIQSVKTWSVNDKNGEMRMKTFLIIFGCVVVTSYIFVMTSSTREQNDSKIKTIVTQTHQHIKEFHVSKLIWDQLNSIDIWNSNLNLNIYKLN